ncbi:unnamed protein product, partial [Effrenium voratum]
ITMMIFEMNQRPSNPDLTAAKEQLIFPDTGTTKDAQHSLCANVAREDGGRTQGFVLSALDVADAFLTEAGDEISFLKRKHLLTVEGNILMTPHVKHFDKYCVNRLYSAMDSRGSKKPMQQMIKLFMISQMVSMTDALSTGDGDIEPNTTRPFASLQIHDFTGATPDFFLEYYVIFSLIFTTVVISVWTFSWLSKCIKSARRLMMFAWQIHHAEPDGAQHTGSVRDVQEQVSADKAVRRRSSAAPAATYWKATKFPLIEFLLRQHAQEELESCFVTRYGRFYHRLGCKWLQNHAATEILLSDLQQRHLARCRTCHSCTETNLPSSSGLIG